MSILVILVAAWFATKFMVQEGAYAVRGKTPPRHEVRMAEIKAGLAKPRYGFGGFFGDLVDDALRATAQTAGGAMSDAARRKLNKRRATDGLPPIRMDGTIGPDPAAGTEVADPTTGPGAAVDGSRPVPRANPTPAPQTRPSSVVHENDKTYVPTPGAPDCPKCGKPITQIAVHGQPGTADSRAWSRCTHCGWESNPGVAVNPDGEIVRDQVPHGTHRVNDATTGQELYAVPPCVVCNTPRIPDEQAQAGLQSGRWRCPNGHDNQPSSGPEATAPIAPVIPINRDKDTPRNEDRMASVADHRARVDQERPTCPRCRQPMTDPGPDAYRSTQDGGTATTYGCAACGTHRTKVFYGDKPTRDINNNGGTMTSPTQQSGARGVAEITGLASAVAYAKAVADAHAAHSTAGGEGYRASLAQAEVTGAGIASAAHAQEKSAEATAAWEAHHTELQKQFAVKEAYLNNPDAGNKQFVTSE